MDLVQNGKEVRYLLDLLPDASDHLVSRRAVQQPAHIASMTAARGVAGLEAQAPLQVIATAHEGQDADGHEHGEHDSQIEIEAVRVTGDRGRQRRVVVMLGQ